MRKPEIKIAYEELKRNRRKIGEIAYLKKAADLYLMDKQSGLFPESLEWIREQRRAGNKRWL